MKLKKNYLLIIIILIFATIFSLISFVNHYLFRTEALDLGMMNHALYNFAHFSQNVFTLDIAGQEVNYFGDHFSPIMFLYAPFYYLFGTYTLLIIQVFSILFGGFGVYKYASLYFQKKKYLILFIIHFFGIWGIYAALSYDFHNNVVAAMFVPWLLYYYEKSNHKMFLVFFVLILLSKENMALWLAFIMIGLISKKSTKNFKKILTFEIPLILFSFLYFLFIVGFLMPYIRDGLGFSQLNRYADLGYSIPEILTTIVEKPSYIFSLLFESPIANGSSFGVKSGLHFIVLVSGGFAIFLKPRFLIMLLPIYAQKFFTNDVGFWGIHLQYSIEFVPIISLSLIHFFSKLKSSNYSYLLLSIVVLSTYFHTYKAIEGERKVNMSFYGKSHYSSNLNVKEIYKQLAKIPNDAILSTNSSISPHVAFRNKIYSFPHIKDANYIVLFTAKKSTYPISKEEQEKKVKELINSNTFEIFYNKNDILILKKKNN